MKSLKRLFLVFGAIFLEWLRCDDKERKRIELLAILANKPDTQYLTNDDDEIHCISVEGWHESFEWIDGDWMLTCVETEDMSNADILNAIYCAEDGEGFEGDDKIAV